MKMFDDAHAIFEEFSLGDVDNHINGSLLNLKMMVQKLYLSKTKLTDENCIDYWWCWIYSTPLDCPYSNSNRLEYSHT